MVKLQEVVLRGFPQSSYDVDEELRQYHKFRHDLHVAGGVMCYKDRAISPTRLRPQVLETIHAAHQFSIYSTASGEFDAKSLVKKTREYFTTFNIPEEIATDGGPQITSTIFQESLKAWPNLTHKYEWISIVCHI